MLNHRTQCAVCDATAFTIPQPDLQPHPYVECSQCGFYYQQHLKPSHSTVPAKTDNTMPQQERDINQWLASAFDGWFPKAQAGKTALDIGSQYPWLSHCLGNLGWQSYALDRMPEIVKFTQNEQLKVHAFECDFEPHSHSGLAWPWDSAAALRFDLITLIHVAEHFYQPMPALRTIFGLLKPGGILFIRCPDSGAPGVERNFSPSHYHSHPQIWCQRALEIAGAKIGFSIKETYPLSGQRDMVFFKPLVPNYGSSDHKPGVPKLALGVGMIVKNEEDDLPACLDSLRDVAELICIIDTGSTDRTLQVIQEWAKANQWQAIFNTDLPEVLPAKTMLVRSYTGASEQDETGDWKLWHFGQARNQYVASLNQHCDWILWMDADDILLDAAKLRPLLTQPDDVFGFGIVNAAENFTTRFIHHRLWRTGLGIEYHGACHEYPGWPSMARVHDTALNIQHRWTTNVSQEPGPSRNLRILEREYHHGERSKRILFYLANTWREAGDYNQAIAIYQEYLSTPPGYWDEHIFCMLYKMRCERVIAYQTGDYRTFFSSLYQALAQEQRFSEISMEAAYAYFDLGNWHKSMGMCLLSLQSLPPSQLFIEHDKYTDQPHRILARCYQQLGEWERAVYHTAQVLKLHPNDAEMQQQLQAWSRHVAGGAVTGNAGDKARLR